MTAAVVDAEREPVTLPALGRKGQMIDACFPVRVRSIEDECAARVGRWIAEARRLARFSQRALGDRVGVSQSTVSRVENGLVPGAHFRTAARILVFLEPELPAAIRDEALRRRDQALADAQSRIAADAD